MSTLADRTRFRLRYLVEPLTARMAGYLRRTTPHLYARIKGMILPLRRLTEPRPGVPGRPAEKPRESKSTLQPLDPVRNEGNFQYWSLLNAMNVMSFVTWDIASQQFRHLYQKTHGTAGSLYGAGVVTGRFMPQEAEELKAAYHACPKVPWDHSDTHPEYHFDAYRAHMRLTDLISEIRAPSDNLLAILGGILERHASQIEGIVGHCWAVPQVWCKTLRPLSEIDQSGDAGGSWWHLDGWPVGIKKLMIYVDGVGGEYGTTEIQDKEGRSISPAGPAGTWVLFENSVVLHRAMPSRTRPRPVIELTLVPSGTTNPLPRNPGLNTTYPWFPVDASPASDDEASAARRQLLERLSSQAAEISGVIGTRNFSTTYKTHLAPGFR